MPADLTGGPDGQHGLYFRPVERAEFDKFTARQATSPETGRFETVYEKKEIANPTRIIRNLGLYGCGKLCAVAICVIIPNKSDGHNSCRLDTVVVDSDLRKQGLATFIITTLFMDLLADPELDITRMFSYAVHPGTVGALSKLHFSDPPPKGAPLIAVDVGGPEDSDVLSSCQTLFGQLNAELQGLCSNCAAEDGPELRWCEGAVSTGNK